MQIISKSRRRRARSCNPAKGLTYANMERYIRVFKNADELLEQFENVKELAAAQSNPYMYVKQWFISQFPNYKELPDFSNLNMIVRVKPAPAPVIKDNKQAAWLDKVNEYGNTKQERHTGFKCVALAFWKYLYIKLNIIVIVVQYQ